MSFSETSGDVSPLFQSFELKQLQLKNRVVMAPMTRSLSPQGVPGDDVSAYYRRRAEGGAGLIITEGTWIPHRTASNEANVPRFHGEDALGGWSKVVDAVHAAGASIMPQLWHVGLTVKPRVEQVFGSEDFAVQPTMGPSGIRVPGGEAEAPPMTQDDIDDVVKAFGIAAKSARDLKFDGVEIHGAHGYLVDQFFWPATNKRTDGYGGSPTHRARFAAEIVRECRRQVGPDFPIGLRISQWKTIDFSARNAMNADELGEWVTPLADAGVDIFHCSTRRYWEPEFPGSSLNLAGWVKTLTGKPTITVGSVGLKKELLESLSQPDQVESQSLAPLIAMMERKEFDLVAVGRALIGDAGWPAKIKEGEDDYRRFSPALLATLT